MVPFIGPLSKGDKVPTANGAKVNGGIELDTGTVSVRGNTAVLPGRGKEEGTFFITTDGGIFLQTYLHGSSTEPGRLVQIWSKEASK